MKETEQSLVTRCAHWGYEEHRFWGYGVSSELVGKLSLIELTILSVLGRTIPPDVCGLFEDAAAALTMADPRIWPLKMTRLVASYGATTPAAAAGLLIMQGAMIGPWSCARAAIDLAGLHEAIGEAPQDYAQVRRVVEQHLREKRILWGLGTPFRNQDERLIAFRAAIEKRGRHRLPYWRTMDAIAAAARDIKRIEPSIALGVAAAFLDIGLKPSEVGPVTTMLSQHMFWSNAIEGATQAPAVLRELPNSAVTYTGVPRRSVPARPATSMVVPKSGAETRVVGMSTKVG